MNQSNRLGPWAARGLYLALFWLGLLGGTLLLWRVGYACPIRGLLGRPCPTCGITRGAVALLQGDFVGAYAANPLLYPLLLLLLLGSGDYLRGRLTQKRICLYGILYAAIALLLWLI